MLRNFTCDIDLEIWFRTTYAVENCNDICSLEYEENLQARINAGSCKRVGGVEGGQVGQVRR